MIIPLAAADIPALLDRTNGIPARAAAQVACVKLDPAHSHWVMATPGWLTDADGSVPLGALGILVDATLGTAVMSSVAPQLAMVTSHLQIEALTPLRADMGPLTCIGRPTALAERFALSAADVTDAEGSVVARASMGSVMFPRTDDTEVTTDDVGDPGELGIEIVERSPGGVRTRTAAHEWLANSYGGLHGGAGFLIGERTLQLAIDPGDLPMRAVEVRAAFLRPIPADGHTIESVATVAHRGRRLGAARGEVRSPDGRPALLVDATYVPC